MRLDFPTELEARWLLAQGVSDTAILEPDPIRAGTVRFWQHAFELDPEGDRALLFKHERDWIAWQPRSGKLASWRGVAFALNEEAIWNPASYFGGLALRIHRTPLEWLKADRDGIVIVQPRLAHAMLRSARALSFADSAFAQLVRRWMESPTSQTELLLEVIAEGEAA